MAPAILERELSPSKKKAVRQTVAGGALFTTKLAAQLPETDDWALDFYFLTKPLAKLVNCTDSEVDTVDEWKAKLRTYCEKYDELGRRLHELAA